LAQAQDFAPFPFSRSFKMFGSNQGFGYAGDAAAPTQSAAPKAAKQEDKQTCLPVTVRILQDAVARHASSQELIIHGVEASIVHVVGVIEKLVVQTAMTEFDVNDATGRMKVRYYTPSGTSSEGLGLVAGSYVSVVGNVRTSPAAHVSAMCLQAVTSGDEVSYHMIEVAHAALKLANPTTMAPPPAASLAVSDPTTPAKQALAFGGFGTGTPSSTVSPMKVDAPVAMSAPMSMQTPPKADLRGTVLALLREFAESAGEEGLGVSTILTRTQASSQKVKEILAKLVDDGEIYSTIDDDHFAML